jgi:uncharacterized protein YciI
MWFLCLRKNLRPREERRVSLAEHFVWMKEQHESGRILISGPSEDRELGIYLIRAGSRDEAEAIAAGDPYTVAGDCAFDLIPWKIHQILGIGSFEVPPAAAS